MSGLLACALLEKLRYIVGVSVTYINTFDVSLQESANPGLWLLEKCMGFIWNNYM